MPFPTSFPPAAMATVLANVTGQRQDSLRVLTEAGYDLLGYGLDIGLPDEGGPQPLRLSAPALAAAMEDHAMSLRLLAETADKRSLNWRVLIPILMELIQQWLAGKR